MPESPVSSTKFSQAPAGKKALTQAELQAKMQADMTGAAEILGGKVTNAPEGSAPVVQPPEEPKIPEFLVSDEDKRKYIRSLLSKEQFTKAYTLFGGMLRATFKTRKTADNEALSDIADSRVRHRHRLVSSLVSVNLAAGSGQMNPVRLEDLDDIAVSAIFQAFNEFESLCDELFRRAGDSDFWTETAGPS